MANDSAIRRDKTFPFCGRLIILDTSKGDIRDPVAVTPGFSIDFPAMPDQIELARRAEYRVQSNMVVPDGVHQYMSTAIQKIPFSFKLHAMDQEYCKEGALTVLKVAARLHALVVPLGNSDLRVTVQNDGVLNDDGHSQPGAVGPKTQANVESKAGKGTTGQATQSASDGSNLAGFSSDSLLKPDPPVGVRLELIATENEGPGINCNGYVEDVRVVLFGPWLRGPNMSQNLPTAGEFSFTFVHRPGHGNWFSNNNGSAAVTMQSQAFADLIRERLFNTRDLKSTSKLRGFDKVS